MKSVFAVACLFSTFALAKPLVIHSDRTSVGTIVGGADIEGFPEGRWVGRSNCFLRDEGYTCDQTLTFTKFSVTEAYSCTNGTGGADGIRFQLNASTGELESPEMPRFKLRCRNSECVIANSEAPQFLSKYRFAGDDLVTESLCDSETSDESAPLKGVYRKQ